MLLVKHTKRVFSVLTQGGACRPNTMLAGPAALSFSSQQQKMTNIIIDKLLFYFIFIRSCFSLLDIAKSLTWGQQEDAHEFLRYVVDAMQKSCLVGTKE